MMPFYPVHKGLKELSHHMPKGNYGLWYNKFIPLNNSESCKPANGRAEDKEAVEFYFSVYGNMKRNSEDVLKQKHINLQKFCDMFPKERYEVVCLSATLKSPLVTGIGESHPHEVSMVFDHNMGIPYIPSSGVKGIVRFAHTISLVTRGIPENKLEKDKEGKLNFDADNYLDIPFLFGNQKNRGRVIFLDAYPEKVPSLHVDIMNPHYGDYYTDDKGKTPPADYLSPNPIKFLTVATGTVFTFRAIAEKRDDLPQKVWAAFISALTQEGVGAKTAIGYGRFIITNINDYETVKPPVTLSVQKGTIGNRQTWESAHLTWSPGNQTLTATFEKHKATTKGKELIPETLYKNLIEKRKPVKARVEVEAVGNSFKIINIVA